LEPRVVPLLRFSTNESERSEAAEEWMAKNQAAENPLGRTFNEDDS